MGLSNKQRVFINEYLQCWNATEAARRAKYAHPNKQGPRLLVNVGIQEEIQARLQEVHMSANEALKLLADQARGDLADFMYINSMGFELDLQAAREAGKTKLIKKMRQQTVTINGKQEDKEIHTIDIELYDAQAAIDKILRVAGKYKDVGSSGNPLTIDNQNGITNEGFDRAISSLSDAIRESLSGPDAKETSEVDTAE